MNIDGDVTKVLPEVNHRGYSESKTVRNGVGSDGQDLSDEDEVRINRISDDVKNVNSAGMNQAQAALQMQQQQPQGSMVCWEKFLHLRSLKVLLVETDDSTRHVVAALLRNCSYEVTEAANGVQAWKVLENLTNHIDIVLTEVVMPFLSGIGLLCKIISHRTRNNTPVIMMSSHDSMGLVFKCLSKGAVDFLVKPIRKNELRNLWQHVWRRCHSSSGSGSESGTQTQKSIKSKSVQKSDNNPGSNEDDNGSNGFDIGDGSDDGSGTQSSWTKQAVEVETPRLMSPWDQLTECPDSTCAQVIHSNTETLVDKCEQEEQIDDVVMGKLEIPVPRNLDLQLEYRNEVPTQLLGTKRRKCPETGSNKINVQVDKGHLDLNSKSPSSRQKFEAANMTGVLTSSTDPQAEGAEFGAPNKLRNIPQIDDKAKIDSKELPSLELSVKRLRGVKDTGTRLQDDHNVLRLSDSSAFSRYNTASNANKASSRKFESDAPLNNTLEVEKSEPLHFIRSPSHFNPPNQSSNEGSNNVDMGSATNNAITKPVVLRNKSVTSSGLQPNKNDLESVARQLVLDKADDVATMETLAHSRGPHLELQVQQPLDHHYNHHLVNNMQHRNPPSDHDDFLLKKLAEAAPQCGSSNALGGIVEGITSNYSLKGSGSGSNQGSNGLNGGSTIMHTGGTNIESYIGLARESGSGDAAGIGNRLDQKKSAQREAALTKFRQKRKERCFRKKVRYQKRQKLAEQRPRVRGQFVRQTLDEDTSRTTHN